MNGRAKSHILLQELEDPAGVGHGAQGTKAWWTGWSLTIDCKPLLSTGDLGGLRLHFCSIPKPLYAAGPQATQRMCVYTCDPND